MSKYQGCINSLQKDTRIKTWNTDEHIIEKGSVSSPVKCLQGTASLDHSTHESQRRLWSPDLRATVRAKEPTCQCRRRKRCGFIPWVGNSPWRRAWPPTPVLLPGESHGQRSLAGYSPWGRKESVMIKWLSMHVGAKTRKLQLKVQGPGTSMVDSIFTSVCETPAKMGSFKNCQLVPLVLKRVCYTWFLAKHQSLILWMNRSPRRRQESENW